MKKDNFTTDYNSRIYTSRANMVVSIEPEANIVQNIVKDNLGSLEVMVKKGQSPHTYEPNHLNGKLKPVPTFYFSGWSWVWKWLVPSFKPK